MDYCGHLCDDVEEELCISGEQTCRNSVSIFVKHVVFSLYFANKHGFDGLSKAVFHVGSSTCMSLNTCSFFDLKKVNKMKSKKSN